MLRDTAPTAPASQQQLPFTEPMPLTRPLLVAPKQVRRLWFCIRLPGLCVKFSTSLYIEAFLAVSSLVNVTDYASAVDQA